MFIKLDGNRVVLEHYKPDELSKEILDSGYIVENEKPISTFKNPILHYDVDKEMFYYESGSGEDEEDPIDKLKLIQIEQDSLIMSLLLGDEN